jgi:uncharacterized protein
MIHVFAGRIAMRCFVLAIAFLALLAGSASPFDLSHKNSELEFARWIRSQQQQPLTVGATAVVHQTVMLPMPDGVRLYTSIYLPSNTGQFPTILVRTPYNVANGGDSFAYSGIADYYCPKGYAVVIQTIRGKYDSEGVYRLLSSGEIDDGFTTVNWISDQPWSNHKVGIMGVSHDGFDALAAGVRNPPSLKLIIAGGAPADFRTDAFLAQATVYTGLLDYIAFITTEIGQPYDDAFYQNYLTRVLNEPRLNLHDDLVEGVQLQLWDELIPQLNTPGSLYWKQRRIRDRFAGMHVPVVHIAGLNGDGDMPDTVTNYITLASNPATRNLQRLILGWWSHGGSGPYGDTKNVSPYLLTRIDAYLAFYLQDKPSSFLNEKKVQFFSQGDKRWILSDSYPVSNQTRTFYLASGGRLSSSAPTNQTAASETYTSNPATVPSFLNMNKLHHAPDQVFYLSDPLPSTLFLTGESSFRLFASSDSQDCDFYVLFFRRTPAGQDFLVGSFVGAINARFRHGPYSAPSLLKPGQVYEYNIRLYPTSTALTKGSRLGIVILSNLNPNIVRNANTGKKIGTDTNFRTAHQRIFHGTQFPSSVSFTIHP